MRNANFSKVLKTLFQDVSLSHRQMVDVVTFIINPCRSRIDPHQLSLSDEGPVILITGTLTRRDRKIKCYCPSRIPDAILQSLIAYLCKYDTKESLSLCTQKMIEIRYDRNCEIITIHTGSTTFHLRCTSNY